MAGTASTVRSWLLLEHAGPWGIDAFIDIRLPEGFGRELLARCAAANVRPVLIRRMAGADAGFGTTAFAIRSGPEPPWIERARLERIEEALRIDLDALGAGERPGLEPHEEALFLVCTHGRHDTCCAERGRPLARSLTDVFPERTWECSHIGGDRFAGNVVAFPHGCYFGWVAPSEAEWVARAYLDGRIDLERFRGRSSSTMAVQAAEHALRVELGLEGIDDVALEHARRLPDEVVATFRTAAGRYRVLVSVDTTTRHILTCRSTREAPIPAYRTTVESGSG